MIALGDASQQPAARSSSAWPLAWPTTDGRAEARDADGAVRYEEMAGGIPIRTATSPNCVMAGSAPPPGGPATSAPPRPRRRVRAQRPRAACKRTAPPSAPAGPGAGHVLVGARGGHVPPLLVTASTKHPSVDAFQISQLRAYLQHPPSRQETAGSSLQANCRRCSPFPGVTEAVQADCRATTLDGMAASWSATARGRPICRAMPTVSPASSPSPW
jgi:hypothetical protein